MQIGSGAAQPDSHPRAQALPQLFSAVGEQKIILSLVAQR